VTNHSIIICIHIYIVIFVFVVFMLVSLSALGILLLPTIKYDHVIITMMGGNAGGAGGGAGGWAGGEAGEHLEAGFIDPQVLRVPRGDAALGEVADGDLDVGAHLGDHRHRRSTDIALVEAADAAGKRVGGHRDRVLRVQVDRDKKNSPLRLRFRFFPLLRFGCERIDRGHGGLVRPLGQCTGCCDQSFSYSPTSIARRF
jgi:hypothetical protein